MIETAPSRREAIEILDSYRIFTNIADEEYKKYRKLIDKEFK